MPDSSSFTKQKLASAVSGGYLALRQMGGSKPNSTFAATQHTTHRPTPPANKSWYNRDSTSLISNQINSLSEFPSDFTTFNSLLRNASPGAIAINSPSLLSYYNSKTPSPNIPAGEQIYALTGTNIPISVLSNLEGQYILIPDSGSITIGNVNVTISGTNLVVGGQSFSSENQISIGGILVDFLIAGSPALIMPMPVFNLDPINFDFLNDFGNSFYPFFKDGLTTQELDQLAPIPGRQIVQPSPPLPFTEIPLSKPIAIKFTPTSSINVLNDIYYAEAHSFPADQTSKYIMVGSSGNITKKQLLLISTDGINWSPSNPNNIFGNGELYCISKIYQGSLFIAGNDGTDNVLYHSNNTGSSWTKITGKCNNERIKKFSYDGGGFPIVITENSNMYECANIKQANSSWTKLNTIQLTSDDFEYAYNTSYIVSKENALSGNYITIYKPYATPQTITDVLLSALTPTGIVRISSKFFSTNNNKLIATATFSDNKDYFITSTNDSNVWQKSAFSLPANTTIDSIQTFYINNLSLYVAIDLNNEKSYSTTDLLATTWTESPLNLNLTNDIPSTPITKFITNYSLNKLSIIYSSGEYPDDGYYTVNSLDGTTWSKTKILSSFSSNNINSNVLSNASSNYFEMRFLVNAPCEFKWAQIVSLDNLTTNKKFDLSALSGTPGSSTIQNINVGDTPPYIFGFYPPKLYELVDNKEYYLVLKLKALEGSQRNLKMKSFYFYFAS